MKKNIDFKKLAIMGITGGVMLASQGSVSAHETSANSSGEILLAGHGCGSGSCQSKTSNSRGYIADADTDTDDDKAMQSDSSNVMTEKSLMDQLSPEGQKMYSQLSPQGKALALKLANQQCKGMNDCKGQGGCKSSTHDCAGKNDCKGQAGGPFKDKNEAVKVAKKLMEKRQGMSGSY